MNLSLIPLRLQKVVQANRTCFVEILQYRTQMILRAYSALWLKHLPGRSFYDSYLDVLIWHFFGRFFFESCLDVFMCSRFILTFLRVPSTLFLFWQFLPRYFLLFWQFVWTLLFWQLLERYIWRPFLLLLKSRIFWAANKDCKKLFFCLFDVVRWAALALTTFK